MLWSGENEWEEVRREVACRFPGRVDISASVVQRGGQNPSQITHCDFCWACLGFKINVCVLTCWC